MSRRDRPVPPGPLADPRAPQLGLAFQLTGSYRYSTVALLVRFDVARGLREAGNVVPSVV